MPPSVYRDQLMVSFGNIRMQTALRLERDREDSSVPNDESKPSGYAARRIRGYSAFAYVVT